MKYAKATAVLFIQYELLVNGYILKSTINSKLEIEGKTMYRYISYINTAFFDFHIPYKVKSKDDRYILVKKDD